MTLDHLHGLNKKTIVLKVSVIGASTLLLKRLKHIYYKHNMSGSHVYDMWVHQTYKLSLSAAAIMMAEDLVAEGAGPFAVKVGYLIYKLQNAKIQKGEGRLLRFNESILADTYVLTTTL